MFRLFGPTRCALILIFGAICEGHILPAALAADSHPIAPVLQPFVDDHTIAGAVVAVATKDRILDLEAVGFADLGAKKPMQTDSLFWLASMSKPLTGTGFMFVVDEGKVNVEEPVEKYLPAFHGQKVAVAAKGKKPELKLPDHPILVREILSHTSGLPKWSSPVDAATLKDAVAKDAALNLIFEPGSRYFYTNRGVDIAARIMEVVTGTPFPQFMNEHLFGPLGMKDTTYLPTKEQLARLAKTYVYNEKKRGLLECPIRALTPPFDNPARQVSPPGGYFSTAGDLIKLCQMLLNGGVYGGKRYLSEAAVKQMTTKQTGPKVDREYGFYWHTAFGLWQHAGAYNTLMTIDPKRGLITIYLIQYGRLRWMRDPNAAKAAEGNRIVPAFLAAAYRLAGLGEAPLTVFTEPLPAVVKNELDYH